MPPKKRTRSVGSAASPAPSSPTPTKSPATVAAASAAEAVAAVSGKGPSQSKDTPRKANPSPSATTTTTTTPQKASSSTPLKTAKNGEAASPSPAKGTSPSKPTASTSPTRKQSVTPLAHSAAKTTAPGAKRSKLERPRGRRGLVQEDNDLAASMASGGGDGVVTSKEGVRALEDIVLQSKVVAPDVSGIRCLAANRTETEVVVARENGSLVLYRVEYFQNIPHFTQLRHTGGSRHHTITRIRYVDLTGSADLSSSGSGAAQGGSSSSERYFLASYLSGQLVLYDSETLFPVHVYQRTGGAIWDFCVVGRTVYAAIADGSWHQLYLHTPSSSTSATSAVPRLELRRIVPTISGADRALSVCQSVALRLVVGTDDAGNVHAWRMAGVESSAEEEAEGSAGSRGLAHAHEALWTTRLAKGMALCSVIVPGAHPVVAVGTSVGDVVVFDPVHGQPLHTFSQHKGPVTTVVADTNVFFASGWHESLRSYRCEERPDGVWYPAEVKRRTHYHEASELLLLPQCQLLLSASRDGTIMYAPTSSVFSSPAMYVNVTTQQFAFAQEKNILLHTRLDRIEAFRTDAAVRHWTPLFAHKISGSFHLKGLWCDSKLRFMVFATDERVVVARLNWRRGAEAAFVLSRIEEVVELPARRGVLDACFVRPAVQPTAAPEATSSSEAAADHEEQTAAATGSTRRNDDVRLYLLLDDEVVFITLSEGYPVIRTPLTASTTADSASSHITTTATRSIRAVNLLHIGGAVAQLVVYGLRGTWRCDLTPDGTPNMESCSIQFDAPCQLARRVPTLDGAGVSPSQQRSQPQTTPSAPAEVVVALSTSEQRYVVSDSPRSGTSSSSSVMALPKTLPHDVIVVAQLPPSPASSSSSSTAPATSPSRRFVGCFSRGVVLIGERQWHMVVRCSVEAAFVMQDNRHVLVLERNLEKALEALPLCWKVRRFGN